MSVDGEEGIQVEDTRLKVEGIFNCKSIACAIEPRGSAVSQAIIPCMMNFKPVSR